MRRIGVLGFLMAFLVAFAITAISNSHAPPSKSSTEQMSIATLMAPLGSTLNTYAVMDNTNAISADLGGSAVLCTQAGTTGVSTAHHESVGLRSSSSSALHKPSNSNVHLDDYVLRSTRSTHGDPAAYAWTPLRC